MSRHPSSVIVVVLALLVAGAAAAQNMLVGGSPELAVSGSVLNGSTVAQSAAPSTTSPDPSTSGTTTTPATTGSTTNGVSATTATTPGTTATAPGTTATIDQIVSFTRVVEAGAPAAGVFAVPAGQRLVVTDVLITNPGAAPVCGASISAGASATPATPTATPIASAPAIESGTGLLCVPAQSSLNVGLTTGLEFAAGQSVVLASTAPSPLHYHLRGFLVSVGS